MPKDMRTWALATCFLTLAACTKPAEVLPTATKAVSEASRGPRLITMQVTEDGFVPDSLKLRANEPVKLLVTRTTDATCATELVIDGTDIKVALPLGKQVEVAWTPRKAGSVKFGCAMDMMVSGVLLVE